MNVLVVFAHPEPRSFNGAMRDAAVGELRRLGHAVEVSDLYAMGFAPALGRGDFTEAADPGYFKPQREQTAAAEHGTFAPEVAGEMEKLRRAGLVIFQFPLWWYSLPAVLKGWVDRVFAMGAFYGGGRWYETGVLRGRRAMLSVTRGGVPGWNADGTDASANDILHHIHYGMLAFVGFDVLPPFIVYGPARMDDAQRAAALAAWRGRVAELESAAPMALRGWAT